MQDPNRQHELPDEIVADLGRLDSRLSVMAPEADRAIAEAASRHFAGRAESEPAPRRRWAVPASLAACLLAAVVALQLFDAAGPMPDDVDGSGTVDILDAFALARMRAEGAAEIGQAEIDALAARIVSLEEAALEEVVLEKVAIEVVALEGAASEEEESRPL